MGKRKGSKQHAGDLLDVPKYKATGIPLITPALMRAGVEAWCREEFPKYDCTGFHRLYRNASQDEHILGQRAKLKQIATLLHREYTELRIKDIAFLMGYSVGEIPKFMRWKMPHQHLRLVG